VTQRDAHKNFAYSTVLTPPSPGASGVTLVVQAGDGAKFPTPPFNVTIWPIGVNPITTNAEVARCTAIATDTLTIARAQEGSTARTVIAGDQIAATITAKVITDIENIAIYNGDWAAGSYSDGDIVVYNGIAYLCTSPTSAAPAAWPGGVTPAPTPFSIGYGTSLPVAPTDGQLYILVDSVSGPTYQWMFRYNAGSSSAYKWEFVGGLPAYLAGGSITTTSTTAVVITGVPTFTVPRSGEYKIQFGCMIQSMAIAGAYNAYAQMFAAGSAIGYSALFITPSVSQQYNGGSVASVAYPALTAGQVLDMRAYMNAANNTAFQFPWYQVTPGRVA